MKRHKAILQIVSLLMAVCMSITPALYAGYIVKPGFSGVSDGHVTPSAAVGTIIAFFNSSRPALSAMSPVFSYLESVNLNNPANRASIAPITEQLRIAAQEFLIDNKSRGSGAEVRGEVLEVGSIPTSDSSQGDAANEKLAVFNHPLILPHLTDQQQAGIQGQYHQISEDRRTKLEAKMSNVAETWKRSVEAGISDVEKPVAVVDGARPNVSVEHRDLPKGWQLQPASQSTTGEGSKEGLVRQDRANGSSQGRSIQEQSQSDMEANLKRWDRLSSGVIAFALPVAGYILLPHIGLLSTAVTLIGSAAFGIKAYRFNRFPAMSRPEFTALGEMLVNLFILGLSAAPGALIYSLTNQLTPVIAIPAVTLIAAMIGGRSGDRLLMQGSDYLPSQPELLKIMADPSQSLGRRREAGQLIHFYGVHSEAERQNFENTLVDILDQERDAGLRITAVNLLADGFGTTVRAFHSLSKAFKEGEDNIRFAAGRALGAFPRAATVLGHALKTDLHLPVRRTAVGSLLKINSSEAITPLLEVLETDPDAEMRFWIIHEMTFVSKVVSGPSKELILPSLSRIVLNDNSPRIRSTAVWYLNEARFIPVLRTVLNSDPEPEVRRRAVDTLHFMTFRVPEAIELLKRAAAQDPDSRIRELATSYIPKPI